MPRLHENVKQELIKHHATYAADDPKLEILGGHVSALVPKNPILIKNEIGHGANGHGNEIGPKIMSFPKKENPGQKNIYGEIQQSQQAAGDDEFDQLPQIKPFANDRNLIKEIIGPKKQLFYFQKRILHFK